MTQIIVGRLFDGNALNGLEWLMDEKFYPMKFDKKKDAIEYIRQKTDLDKIDIEKTYHYIEYKGGSIYSPCGFGFQL